MQTTLTVWPPAEAGEVDVALRVSARTGEGVPELLDALVARLPEAPPLYPEDQLSDRPLRFIQYHISRNIRRLSAYSEEGRGQCQNLCR